ncbi:9312_t:CDS:1, partial [Racocetra persica]
KKQDSQDKYTKNTKQSQDRNNDIVFKGLAKIIKASNYQKMQNL